MINNYQYLENYQKLYFKDKIVFDHLVTQFNLNKASKINLYIVTKSNKQMYEYLKIPESTFKKILLRLEKANLIMRRRRYGEESEESIKEKGKTKKTKKKKDTSYLQKYLEKNKTSNEKVIKDNDIQNKK